MDLSIVIAVSGRTRHLQRALHTLTRQRRLAADPQCEIIVIDNSRAQSPQQSTKLVCHAAVVEAGTNNCSVRYVATRHPNPRHKNCSYAKNVGIRMATAPVVMFSDGDVLHVSDTIREHVDFHAQYPGSVLQVFCRDCPPDVELDQHSLQRAIRDRRYPVRASAALRWVGGPCFSAPRHALLAVGGIEETFSNWGYEDYDLVRRLRLVGCVVRHDDNIRTLHQQHAPAGWFGLRMKAYAGLRQIMGVVVANPNEYWGNTQATSEIFVAGSGKAMSVSTEVTNAH